MAKDHKIRIFKYMYKYLKYRYYESMFTWNLD